ncbi:MAG: hypothetical protein LBR35_01445 [Rickettsiales bacterium]|jgi:glutaredoxin|nr:hypothetical protein [Rickettsiales bacterium]
MKKPNVTIYYNPTCPYCHMALEFFANELPDITLEKIELNGGEGKNHDLFLKALNKCEFEMHGIPLIVIGEKCFQGFNEETANQIKQVLNHND